MVQYNNGDFGLECKGMSLDTDQLTEHIKALTVLTIIDLRSVL